MGGHSAWRKRVENGELAIQSGGAIARHRPRWGRKGEDLKLNRKGNIAGGNPKKMKKKNKHSSKDNQQQEGHQEIGKDLEDSPMKILIIASVSIICLSFLGILRYFLSSLP
mmetsp:Transcript_43092/g.104290  ORF Transcript_43092/g.104290 Transcript_43092/m.104290 type:complete len:111 (-) Transcript_43092:2006-2338(-)|eukprot:CAMPEP_0113645526 /NCGR_PEP_ID=MMETSP0017_2-20120614/24003_1 /TAXON_ID=2856 /ORGANISM="Cylindrotheca closterium" /LENGTH=110 /DNA_ID=CAMNT_0000557279 /DNA_START=73 /DNA_END=405 /DNA_ORIENTATION=+ /assembly_acc=CAM_ASM_000147